MKLQDIRDSDSHGYSTNTYASQNIRLQWPIAFKLNTIIDLDQAHVTQGQLMSKRTTKTNFTHIENLCLSSFLYFLVDTDYLSTVVL